MSARSGPAGRCTHTVRRPPGAESSASERVESTPGWQAGVVATTTGPGADGAVLGVGDAELGTASTSWRMDAAPCRATMALPAPTRAKVSPIMLAARAHPIVGSYPSLLRVTSEPAERWLRRGTQNDRQRTAPVS